MAKAVVQLSFARMDQQTLTVGTSAVSFPTPNSAKITNPEKVFVQAPSTNVDSIIVGKTGVLANLTAGGFELLPGSSLEIPMNEEGQLKAISNTAAQKLLVTYVESPN
jgi:hypothetical protein